MADTDDASAETEHNSITRVVVEPAISEEPLIVLQNNDPDEKANSHNDVFESTVHADGTIDDISKDNTTDEVDKSVSQDTNLTTNESEESVLLQETSSIVVPTPEAETNGSISKGRSLRRRTNKRKYALDSDDEANFDVPSPKQSFSKSQNYYSDEEYVPDAATEKYISSDENIPLEEENEPKKRRKGRPRKNFSPKKRAAISLNDDSQSTEEVNEVVLVPPAKLESDDVEETLNQSIICVDEKNKKIKTLNKRTSNENSKSSAPKSAMGKAFEHFVSNIGSNDLQIKKLPVKQKVQSKESLIIPTLNLPEVMKKVQTGSQTDSIKTANSSVQTSSAYAITHIESCNFNETQTKDACTFMENILKTTSELGHVMTSKSEEFLQKKVNAEQMQSTANLDYCIKKAFLLFKLAKDNLCTMEETLEQQYEAFVRTHKLTSSFCIEQKIAPSETEKADSDCEIVCETPAPPPVPKPKVSAAKKVFLNKELSIKVTKKPDAKPKANAKEVPLPGRHAVWINNSIMVKKVKPNQPFLVQGSRTKKPPDSNLLTICKNFFARRSLNNRNKFNLEPYIKLGYCDKYMISNQEKCFYFTVTTDCSMSEIITHSDINPDFEGATGVHDAESDVICDINTCNISQELNVFNPKSLSMLCTEHFNNETLQVKRTNQAKSQESTKERLFKFAVQNFCNFFRISLKNNSLGNSDITTTLKPLKSLTFEKVAAFLRQAIQSRNMLTNLPTERASSLKHLCFLQIKSILSENDHQTSCYQPSITFGNGTKPLKLSQCCLTTILQQLQLNDEFEQTSTSHCPIKLPEMSYEDINSCLRKTFSDCFSNCPKRSLKTSIFNPSSLSNLSLDMLKQMIDKSQYQRKPLEQKFEDKNSSLRKSLSDTFSGSLTQKSMPNYSFNPSSLSTLCLEMLNKINNIRTDTAFQPLSSNTFHLEIDQNIFEANSDFEYEDDYYVDEPETITSLGQPKSLLSSVLSVLNNLLLGMTDEERVNLPAYLESLKGITLKTINKLLFPYANLAINENQSDIFPVITDITTLIAEPQQDEDLESVGSDSFNEGEQDYEYNIFSNGHKNVMAHLAVNFVNIKPEPADNIEQVCPEMAAVKTEVEDPDYMVNIHDPSPHVTADPIRIFKNENPMGNNYTIPHISASAPDFEAFERVCVPRVRREHDPDSDEDILPDSLLVPLAEGKEIDIAKGQLLESSDSDGVINKSKEKKKRFGKQKKVKFVSSDPKSNKDKTIPSNTNENKFHKEKSKENEINVLTRKMRQKLQNEKQKKSSKSDSEDEIVNALNKHVENDKSKSHDSDEDILYSFNVPNKESKEPDSEEEYLYCFPDSTANIENDVHKIVGKNLKDVVKSKKKAHPQTILPLKSPTLIPQLKPELNEYTKNILKRLNKVTPEELKSLEEAILQDYNFSSLSRSEMKKYVNQKIIDIRAEKEILLRESNNQRKTRAIEKKLPTVVPVNPPISKGPQSGQKEKMEHPVKRVVKKPLQPYEVKDGWDLFRATPGDEKLYCPPDVVLNKLPESFVQTYFEYIKTFDSQQKEIERLLDLKSLHRKMAEQAPGGTSKQSKARAISRQLSSKVNESVDVNAPMSSEGEESDRDFDDTTPEFSEPNKTVDAEAVIENVLARKDLIAESNSETDDADIPANPETVKKPKKLKKKATHVPSETPAIKQELETGVENIEIEVKVEYDDMGNRVITETGGGTKILKKRLPGPKSKPRYESAPMDPKDLVLTAEKTMKDNLDRLHAPVNFGNEAEPKKKKEKSKKAVNHEKKMKVKEDVKAESGSDEEEKLWLSTKERLLIKMRKQQEKNERNAGILADDVKGSEMVKSYIVKRSAMQFPARMSRKKRIKLMEEMEQEREKNGEGPEANIKKTSTSFFKGRKNIKKVIDKRLLARSTVLANKEEHERKQRLAEIRVQLRSLFGLDDSVNVFIINEELCLEFDMAKCQPSISVDKHLTNVMKPHQYEGVKFMWDACYESESRAEEQGGGCILAHCMGLGKTLQVIALLHTILSRPSLKAKTVLVCCPLSTVLNWVDEIQHWLAPIQHKIKVFELSKLKKLYERAYQLDDWFKEGGIFILGYEMFRSLTTIDPLIDQVRPTIVYKIRNALIDPGPDLVICDEGHLLKNESSALAVAMSHIRTKRRIVLTGTPMQNNLREYYCMVNFVKPNLLGTYREYLNRFEDPIMNGQHRDSSNEDIKLMRARSHILHKVLEGCLQRLEASVLYPYLPTKHEYVLFVSMTQCQMDLYKHYLTHYAKKMGIFKDFHVLQKIWTHPRALHLFYTTFSSVKKESPEEAETREAVLGGEHTEKWWLKHLNEGKMLDVLSSSNKMELVFEILRQCERADDKLLVFSSSLYTLNTIEFFLKKHKKWNLGKQYFRIDGSVPLEIRQKWCKEFNSESNHITKLFLMSTRAGCLGVNLTGANRVIILDTSWNPAHDIQSIFRVYRFGQKKDCFIYRIVAKGTMEQKIYERAVTKQAISCRVVDEQQIDRHYKSEELTALYNFDEEAAMEQTEGASWAVVAEEDKVLMKLMEKPGPRVLRGVALHDSLLRHMCDEQLDENERAAAWKQFRLEEQQRSCGGKKKTPSKQLQHHDELIDLKNFFLNSGVGSIAPERVETITASPKLPTVQSEESILPDFNTARAEESILPDDSGSSAEVSLETVNSSVNISDLKSVQIPCTRPRRSKKQRDDTFYLPVKRKSKSTKNKSLAGKPGPKRFKKDINPSERINEEPKTVEVEKNLLPDLIPTTIEPKKVRKLQGPKSRQKVIELPLSDEEDDIIILNQPMVSQTNISQKTDDESSELQTKISKSIGFGSTTVMPNAPEKTLSRPKQNLDEKTTADLDAIKFLQSQESKLVNDAIKKPLNKLKTRLLQDVSANSPVSHALKDKILTKLEPRAITDARSIQNILGNDLYQTLISGANHQKFVVFNVSNDKSGDLPKISDPTVSTTAVKCEKANISVAKPKPGPASKQKKPQTIDISDDEDCIPIPMKEEIDTPYEAKVEQFIEIPDEIEPQSPKKTSRVRRIVAPDPCHQSSSLADKTKVILKPGKVTRNPLRAPKVQLHPALFENPWFEKIIKDEMCIKLNSTPEEAALAAKQLMLVLLRAAKPVTDGVVYDIAVDKLGERMLETLWRTSREFVINARLTDDQFDVPTVTPKQVLPVPKSVPIKRQILIQPMAAPDDNQQGVVPVGLISNVMRPQDPYTPFMYNPAMMLNSQAPIPNVSTPEPCYLAPSHDMPFQKKYQFHQFQPIKLPPQSAAPPPVEKAQPVLSQQQPTKMKAKKKQPEVQSEDTLEPKRIKMKISTRDSNYHIVESTTKNEKSISLDSDSDTEIVSEPLSKLAQRSQTSTKDSHTASAFDILKNVVIIQAPEETVQNIPQKKPSQKNTPQQEKSSSHKSTQQTVTKAQTLKTANAKAQQLASTPVTKRASAVQALKPNVPPIQHPPKQSLQSKIPPIKHPPKQSLQSKVAPVQTPSKTSSNVTPRSEKQSSYIDLKQKLPLTQKAVNAKSSTIQITSNQLLMPATKPTPSSSKRKLSDKKRLSDATMFIDLEDDTPEPKKPNVQLAPAATNRKVDSSKRSVLQAAKHKLMSLEDFNLDDIVELE